MDRVTLETIETPLVKFDRINGSLRLKGWDRPRLRADSESEDTLSVNQAENTITIASKSGCIARVPMESNLEIKRVDGELMLKSIEGEIDAGEVYGQFMTKSVGPIRLNLAASNVNCRSVEGDFTCDTINGNANLQDVDGQISVELVKGNLVIKGYSTGINATTRGNATLRLEPQPNGIYHITANGNIHCRLTSDSSAKIVLKSNSKNIKISNQGQSESIQASEHELTIGDGESQITLEARGIVDLNIPVEDDVEWSFEFDMDDEISTMADDISQIVSEQIESQLEVLNENLGYLSTNLSAVGPAASAKARAKIEAQRSKLERKLAQVERRTAERARQASRRTTRRFASPKPASDPVTDEERQKVLEMLQNKLISVQDAEVLLAALEGRQPDLPSSETDEV